MLREKIDGLISEATINGKKFELEVLRLIKAEYMKYNASKDALSHKLDDNVEIAILKKMVKQRLESVDMYKKANRQDLADKEKSEADFIKQFMPAEASIEEIENEVNAIISSGVEPVKKNMGQIIKSVKSKFPTADGKTVSQIVSGKLS